MPRTPGYATSIVILHWLLALAIFVLIGTGWYMVGLEKGTPPVSVHYNFHKSIGLIAMALIALLVGARLRRHPPDLPGSLARWERRAAHLAHMLMYVFLVLVPLSGYVASNFSKWGINFFGTRLPAWGPDLPAVYDLFNAVHVVASNVFVGLIALHVLGAIKHLLARNRVVERILPRALRHEEP
ncbi:cytochrome b [Coralloluteibacterium stylophorae]|uniref:Cytochrome b n=1 Tax=Coralloluteibacterium stylophorae TaxID=1776034 RepID=A0A8J8AWQ0_9GAMM|nr:cytochrome b [Coralloluteibacterium stylophorae]MBS7458448.1 cytochrome b [Coralloluteibacterium stylophorae]